jgi:hypothetical protein
MLLAISLRLRCRARSALTHDHTSAWRSSILLDHGIKPGTLFVPFGIETFPKYRLWEWGVYSLFGWVNAPNDKEFLRHGQLAGSLSMEGDHT